MLQRTVSSDADKTYADLKAALAKKGCKIRSEEPSKRILAVQGSLWGTQPKTAKKTLEIDLSPFDSGTRVTWTSRLSSDWKNLTIIGCALAAVLVGLCGWMAFDLSNFIASQKTTFWSFLVTVHGNADTAVARAFVNLTETLAVFLAIIIIFELVVFWFAHARIDGFAEETLASLALETNKDEN